MAGEKTSQPFVENQVHDVGGTFGETEEAETSDAEEVVQHDTGEDLYMTR